MACKTEEFYHLYSHVLQILPKSLKSKSQLVHQQNSSLTSLNCPCQVNSDKKASEWN